MTQNVDMNCEGRNFTSVLTKMYNPNNWVVYNIYSTNIYNNVIHNDHFDSIYNSNIYDDIYIVETINCPIVLLLIIIVQMDASSPISVLYHIRQIQIVSTKDRYVHFVTRYAVTTIYGINRQ